MNCLEHQICMLAHLRAFPNLFLNCSVLGLVYRREFFIDSKHAGEQQVSSPFAWRFRDKFRSLNICTPRQYTDVFHCEGTSLFPTDSRQSGPGGGFVTHRVGLSRYSKVTHYACEAPSADRFISAVCHNMTLGAAAAAAGQQFDVRRIICTLASLH